MIRELATVEAVDALKELIKAQPNSVSLPFDLIEAEKLMRARTWRPLTLAELFKVTDRHASLVSNPGDLLEVLVEALQKYETELHGPHNPIRHLWDRQGSGKTFRPIEEDGLSDDVKLFLERELVTQGIIANREVEIGRVPGAPIGRRTDIRINAVRKADDGSTFDLITGVIETKGCWNAELLSALESQLYKDYMLHLGAPVGIYLVGWFDKPKWDTKDARRGRTPNRLLADIQSELDTQAIATQMGFLVRAVVLDCHAP